MVTLPNSHRVKVTHSGFVSILPNLVLQNVLYIPSFKFNLMFIHKSCKYLKRYVLFTPTSSFLLQGPSLKSPLEIGKEKGSLYIIKPRVSKSISKSFLKSSSNLVSKNKAVSAPKFNSCFSFSNSNVKGKLWHYRLGHMPLSSMRNIASILVSSISNFTDPCVICPMARQSKLPFPSSSISTKSVFELIHVDTWGPYKSPTYDGFRYFLTIVNDFSRRTWTYLLSTKLNAFPILKFFLAMVERQFHTKVQIIRSDNAFELGSGKT